MPRPQEVATLLVRGRKFEDWESVWVQARWGESCTLFRFTCAEREPIPPNWTQLQFKPGDSVQITLAGKLAVTGLIINRQVSYDAESHGVSLDGKSDSWWAAKSGVRTKDGNFDEMGWKQIADKVCQRYGVAVIPVGNLDNTPFKRCQNEPGELVWDFLERLARPRGIVLSSDSEGNFLAIGEHTGKVVDHLIEGLNILRCQALISIEDIFSEYWMRGQTAASDEQYGPKSSEQEATAKGSAPRFSNYEGVAEQPVWSAGELQARANYEAIWHEYRKIEVNAVVQGWLNGSGDLWKPGDDVKFTSRMAMLDDVLKIQTATFTQDSQSGTLTTLLLVNPPFLRDQGSWNVGNPGMAGA